MSDAKGGAKVPEKVFNLIYFLKCEFPDGIQCFYSRNLVGDVMGTIYDTDGITVDFCANYDYIEIFGLEKEEYNYVVEAVEKDRWSDYWE